MDRRQFLRDMIALGLAPAIVKAGNIMPVKVLPSGIAVPDKKIETFDLVFVGQGGDVVCKLTTGETITFANCESGQWLPVQVTGIDRSKTTARDIILSSSNRRSLLQVE